MADLTHKKHRVYTRQYWFDEWTLQVNVYANSCTFAVSPDMPEAELVYNHGKVMRPGLVVHDTSVAKNLVGHYVKIEIEQDAPLETKRWYGVILEDTRRRDGNLGSRLISTGRQTLYCRGMEYFLQRTIIDSSWIVDADGEKSEIERAIAFNLGSGTDAAAFYEPNAAPDKESFASDLASAKPWSQWDILVYLINKYRPSGEWGDSRITWNVSHKAEDILRATTKTVHAHGKSLKAIIDEIVDRRRLMAWYLEVGPAEDVTVTVFTFNSADLALPDGTTIPANRNTKVWDIDYDVAVDPPEITQSVAAKFHRVIARGERRTICFTLDSSATGSLKGLEPDWPTELETAYKAGATGAAAYSGMDDFSKEAANQAARASPKLERVYRWFRVPEQSTGLEHSPGVFTRWFPGIRFLPYLTLKSGKDYTVFAATPDDIPDNTEAHSKSEYLRPFGVFAKTTYAGESLVMMDRIGRGELADDVEAGGIEWACSLRMRDDAPGVIIDVHGAPQHVIADGHFVAADDVDTASWGGTLDYDKMAVTVCMEEDAYAEAWWPEEPIADDSDIFLRQIINVPNARLDYLAGLTLLGIDEDGDGLLANGGYIADDLDRLKAIARTAYQWYSTPRNAIRVTRRQLSCPFELGQLILALGPSAGDATSTVVNTCVTSVTYNFLAGSATISTQFASLGD